jgi:hypothetical protein
MQRIRSPAAVIPQIQARGGDPFTATEVATSTQVFASNEATSIASVANVDMKLEVIVIHRFLLD